MFSCMIHAGYGPWVSWDAHSGGLHQSQRDAQAVESEEHKRRQLLRAIHVIHKRDWTVPSEATP